VASIFDLRKSVLEHPSVWLLGITGLGGFLYLWISNSWGFTAVTFKVDQSNILSYMAPLIVTSALIERAVEVVISPWRDKDADHKTNKVAAAAVAVTATAGDPAALQLLANSKCELTEYTGKTRQYAYAIALALSVVAVVAGIRTLWPMLPMDATTNQARFPGDAGQRFFFNLFDQALTALLLAGGAAGLHAPINGLTTFFERGNS
jgi:hypothetical protein